MNENENPTPVSMLGWTEAMIEIGAAAAFKTDYPKDTWEWLGPGYHQDRYKAMIRAAFAATVQGGELEAKLQTAIYRLCVIEDSPNLNAAEKALLRTWIAELKAGPTPETREPTA